MAIDPLKVYLTIVGKDALSVSEMLVAVDEGKCIIVFGVGRVVLEAAVDALVDAGLEGVLLVQFVTVVEGDDEVHFIIIS